jgi:hypothetical protein
MDARPWLLRIRNRGLPRPGRHRHLGHHLLLATREPRRSRHLPCRPGSPSMLAWSAIDAIGHVQWYAWQAVDPVKFPTRALSESRSFEIGC